MSNRISIVFAALLFSLSLHAQTDDNGKSSQKWLKSMKATLLKAQNLEKWNIPAGNYSGITPLGNDHYAVVTDKPKGNGFYEFEIKLNNQGKVISAKNLGFRCDSVNKEKRDMEGIVYMPSSNTVFISAENDQQILEYGLDGQLTGRKLNVPEEFSHKKIQSNYGFEALAYSPKTRLFWTTTENMLKSDIEKHDSLNIIKGGSAILRLLSYPLDSLSETSGEGSESQRMMTYGGLYKTDAPLKRTSKYKFYCFGVPEMTALPDGSLLVMERELYVPRTYFKAFVQNKIYRVFPENTASAPASRSLPSFSSEHILKKTLITKFRTKIRNLSNYEGMCLGPKLPDGSQTLLIICDSQDRYGKLFYHLKDRLQVVLLK